LAPERDRRESPRVLRLVTRRHLWDAGTALAHSPSLAGLAPEAFVGVSPADLSALGLREGARVTVRSARSSLELPLHADASVPTGSAVVSLNLPGGSASGLIDASERYTEVTIDAGEGRT
jgi:anaerobic selenocysteine-containing dehydrogenase